MIEYTPDPRRRAERIAAVANAREAEGERLISVLATPNCGAILVFRAPTVSEKK